MKILPLANCSALTLLKEKMDMKKDDPIDAPTIEPKKTGDHNPLLPWSKPVLSPLNQEGIRGGPPGGPEGNGSLPSS